MKEWLTRKEAADYLASLGCAISAKTLSNMACNNNGRNGPTFTRSGWTCVRYRREDLDKWAAARSDRVAWREWHGSPSGSGSGSPSIPRKP